MNALRKKSAITAYGHLKTGEEIRDALALVTDKPYSPVEADEIVSAILSGDTGGEQPSENRPSASSLSVNQTSTLNNLYEEWKVKEIFEDVVDGMGKVIGRKFIKFEKDAQKPIRTTSVHPDTAELLNSQSGNTLLHLFKA